MNGKSCVGCKFLYIEGYGYSNYTCEDSSVKCALDKNPNLPSDEPADWNEEVDNWPATMNARCDMYAPGKKVELDVDGENGPADQTQDEEAISAICKHSGRGRHGA